MRALKPRSSTLSSSWLTPSGISHSFCEQSVTLSGLHSKHAGSTLACTSVGLPMHCAALAVLGILVANSSAPLVQLHP